MKIYEKAPAKINLSLDVLHKRTDGYHEVEMVMTEVDLADRLELEEIPRDAIIISSQAGYIPLDEKNLAFQAARLLKERYGIRRGVYIHMVKKIPVAAGLAGGSSDAAAALRALNRLWGLNLPLAELEEVGAEIGSDVPFCVRGGTAVARGRGERLESIAPPPVCWAILAKPPIHVSTADVYGKFDRERINCPPFTGNVLRAIENQSFEQLCASIGNMLEEVTMQLHSDVRRIKLNMLRQGAEGALMSGSGPTVYCLVRRDSKLKRIYNGLRGFCREVYPVRLLR